MSAFPQSLPTVVVVTCYGGQWLARAVASLHAQSLAPARIVIAVSHPDPVDLPPGPEVVRCASPSGFAVAANRGLEACAGVPVIVLNDDIDAHPQFVEALHSAHLQHGPGIYQPRIVLADSPDGVDRIDNTGHRLFLDGFNIARERGRPVAQSAPPPCGEVGAFSGAAALITPEVLTATGGFDPDFEAFGEDLDLSLRARRAGFRIRFVDDAHIQHALGASYGRTGHRKLFLVERNRVRAAVRSLPRTAIATLPFWTGLRLATLGVAAIAGRGIGAGVGAGGAAAALVGGLAGALAIPDALRKRRTDRRHWTVDDREMWEHMIRHHARPEDLVRGAHP